jgi:hypothetical protein
LRAPEDEAHFLQALMRGLGLGVVTQQDGCATPGLAYGRNGGGDGYMSSVQVSPEGNRFAVVLVNGYGMSSAAQDQGSETLFNTMQRLYCTR